MESRVESWRPRTIASCDFSTPSVSSAAAGTKGRPGHTKCCTCHAKSSWQTWRSHAPKCNTYPRKMFWNCYNTLTFCSLWTRCTIPCACKTTTERPKVVRACGAFKHFDLEMRFPATTACTFSTSQLPKALRHWGALRRLPWKCFAPQRRALFSNSSIPKVVRACGAFNISTWKCASRHNCVRFFDIATSTCAPNVRCFLHFDFEMCFAPQRRVIFHLSSPQTAPHPPL